MKRLLSYLLACLTALMPPAPEESAVPAEIADPPTAQELQVIRDIITAYGHSDQKQIETRLTDLTEISRDQGERWAGILDNWTYINQELEIPENKLRTDLPNDNTLCIAVLGYQLNPDGTMQRELLGRLQTALNCAKQYPNAYILCTGGGTASWNPDATEADEMGKWLREQGVKPERLILENASLSTAENAHNSCEILRTKYPEIKELAIVTSTYHVPWGTLMFDTECMMRSAVPNEPALRVTAACAFGLDKATFSKAENLHCQTAGMLELIGEYNLANDYYYGRAW